MTAPHLMNCPHREDGWCLDCVADLGNENWRLREQLAAEREACAKICDAAAKEAVADIEYRDACFDLGKAIRLRSNVGDERRR